MADHPTSPSSAPQGPVRGRRSPFAGAPRQAAARGCRLTATPVGPDRAERTRAGSRSSCRSATSACSPRRFAFYRGTASVMGGTATIAASPNTEPQRKQLCGDAHLANFGGLSPRPDRAPSSSTTSTTSTRDASRPRSSGDVKSGLAAKLRASPGAIEASRGEGAAGARRARRALGTGRTMRTFAAQGQSPGLVRKARLRRALGEQAARPGVEERREGVSSEGSSRRRRMDTRACPAAPFSQ